MTWGKHATNACNMRVRHCSAMQSQLQLRLLHEVKLLLGGRSWLVATAAPAAASPNKTGSLAIEHRMCTE